MSLDKRKEQKTKKITIVGSEDDIRTLGDVIRQTYQMFNIDLDKGNIDLPPRIGIRDDVDPEAIDYPRTAKILHTVGDELSDGPKEGTKAVSFGDIKWKLRVPKATTPGIDVPDVVKVMQSVAEGTSIGGLSAVSPTKYFAGYNFMSHMDDAIEKKPEVMPAGLYGTLQPSWVYIQNIDMAPKDSLKSKGKKKHDSPRELVELEKGRKAGTPEMKRYPADLGEIKTGRKKEEATQGYVAVFRGNYDYDLNQPLKISQKEWNNFIKKIPINLLSAELKKKPKTVGDMLEIFFAYDVATTMKLKNAAVRPVATGRSKIFTELMEDKGEQQLPGQPPARRGLGTQVLYSAVVVGTGKYIPATYDAGNLKQADVPGWN